jgi:lysyl-tRNA synthetase, class II
MNREEQIIHERTRKIVELKKMGINPYAHRFTEKLKSADLKKKYESLSNETYTNDFVRIAGRVMTIRELGKITFVKILDGSGNIQIILQKEKTPQSTITFFKKYIDSGDFIGIEGNVCKTKTGEISVLVNKATMLTKSILPLPEKWHGLKDEEERYRKRYLDMTMNSQSKEIFIVRAKILETIREFMKKNDFIEIETPLLQACYGGACAKPFKTYCSAYDSNLFLSIAPELYLKKALVGGFERVYEITKKFRNEGVDRQHNPEHMTIEWYQAYADYNDGMILFEDLIKDIAMKLFGKLIFEYQGETIDLKKWKRIPLLEAIKEYLNIDIANIKDDAEAKKIAQINGIDPEEVTKISLPENLMKLFRGKIIQPTFLIDYPIEMSPLAKTKENDPSKAEVFQPIIGGLELARAYSELNDSELQKNHFKQQEEEREKGNMEAMITDKDFINALKYGMPPACGVGIGIERLVMLFNNQTTIRNVIMFPFMKPEA